MTTDAQDYSPLDASLPEEVKPILYENEPLETLLSTLPKTLGIMKHLLIYTCFDVSNDYFAVGTNLGLVCLYSFQSQNMQFIQNRSDPITYILIDSMKKWVAMGDKQGAVTMFNFNKEMLFATQEKSHSSVTCLAWGRESTVLFSGYASGKIIVSDFQSDKNSLHSKVLTESGPALFQLSYHRNLLLVSNQQRSFLLQLGADTLPTNSINIGSKERKQGLYGAAFFQDEKNETKIAVARPGFRIWFVALDGSVESTAKMKDLIFTSAAPPISFMGRTQPSLIPSTELQFTYLQAFQGRYLISWCQNHLWVLDPVKLRVLGQTSGLRNVRWTVGQEGDLYVFHDGYQIFRKVSLHSDYVIQKPAVPPPTLSTALAEGEVLQEVNGIKLVTDNALQDMKYPMVEGLHENWSQDPIPESSELTTNSLRTPEVKQSSQSTPESGLRSVRSPISEIHSKLKEKLNEEIVQRTKHFLKESVAPILEKTNTYLTPAKQPSEPAAHPDAPVQREESEFQAEQPLAFASKTEQLRRLATIDSAETEELVVRIKKKKRHKKKARGPSRASSMSSLLTDTTSDLSEQPELDLILQTAESSDLDACRDSEAKLDAYKPDPNDAVVEKDRQHKEEISKLRESQMEKDGEVKFAFTYLSESSNAIQLRQSLSCDEQETKSDVEITSGHLSDGTPAPEDESTPLGDPVIDRNAFNGSVELVPGNLSGNSEDEAPKSDSPEPFVDLDLKESIVLPIQVNSPEKLTPVNGDLETPVEIQLLLSENYFSPPKKDNRNSIMGELFSPDLETYDIIQQILPASERHFSKTTLSDSEDNDNPLYTEKLSRIINRRSRSYAHGPSTLDKHQESTPEEAYLDSSESANLTSSITMEEELQPQSTLPFSGNHWSAFKLPFTQSTVSLSISDHALWMVEGGKGQIYWCKSSKSQMRWTYLPGMYATQVATSYNGLVVLAVNKENQLFQRKGVTQTNIAGKVWDRIYDGVTCISCGPTTFWAISFTGDVLFTNYSDPILFRTIASVIRFKQISSSDSITVALGMDNFVYLRTGITAMNMMGEAWRSVTQFEVSCVAVCLTTVWAIGMDDRVYFNPELRNSRTSSNRTALEPNESWFEVMLHSKQVNNVKKTSGGYMQRLPFLLTHTAQTMLWPTLNRMPGSDRLSGALPKRMLGLGYETSQLISCSILGGVWVLSGQGGQRLYHCDTQIIGVKYLPLFTIDEYNSPFISVSANYASGDQGLSSDHIWALKANGGLVAFDTRRKMHSIPSDRSMELRSVSTCEDCLWCLDLENRCWVRTQISPSNPIGVKWISPDMGNLRGEPLRSISCGLLSIWAVSKKGEVWLRFGSSPSSHTFEKKLSPIWLKLDEENPPIEMKQVSVGPGDWKVWALSQDNHLYIRKDITRDYPIGSRWERVPDMLAAEFALSAFHVWVLDPSGSLHVRMGVSLMNPSGNYWKPVIGKKLQKITVTPYGQVWCIDEKGELLCRLERNYLENDLVSSCVSINTHSISGWEIL